MYDRRHQDEMIEAFLREVHESTAPVDSWQALRGRIESRCRTAARPGEVFFWRRIAFAAAACFFVTAMLLGYLLLQNPSVRPASSAAAQEDPPLLDGVQVERLARAFAQVRSVFAGQSPWFMVDSLGNSQLGLAQGRPAGGQPQRLIVLRLVLRDEQSPSQRSYADLVAFPQQRIEVQMRTAQGSSIEVSLVPALEEDGRISLHVAAQGDGGSHTEAIATVDESAYRPLVHVRAGTLRIALDATAQSKIILERG
jgi:hypothetical protein